jgi:hypothetical protein
MRGLDVPAPLRGVFDLDFVHGRRETRSFKGWEGVFTLSPLLRGETLNNSSCDYQQGFIQELQSGELGCFGELPPRTDNDGKYKGHSNLSKYSSPPHPHTHPLPTPLTKYVVNNKFAQY